VLPHPTILGPISTARGSDKGPIKIFSRFGLLNSVSRVLNPSSCSRYAGPRPSATDGDATRSSPTALPHPSSARNEEVTLASEFKLPLLVGDLHLLYFFYRDRARLSGVASRDARLYGRLGLQKFSSVFSDVVTLNDYLCRTHVRGDGESRRA